MRKSPYNPTLALDVVFPDEKSSEVKTPCVIGNHIWFDSDAMQGFVPNTWQSVIYDAMLLIAAVEICDYSRARSQVDWARNFTITLPVHEPDRWNQPDTKGALIKALNFLTGDNWSIKFRKTQEPQSGPAQRTLDFPHHANMVIPYSDGLDSSAIAGIFAKQFADSIIVRVRIGSNRIKKPKPGEVIRPFENVPFRVRKVLNGNGESSGRSRGFKFGLLAGLAAYLIGAPKVIVPESGQGALGPVLVNVGQAHYDRRTHPEFTALMSEFMEALFGIRIDFEHPMIFGTKGQTLTTYRSLYPDHLIWKDTRSCWMDQRHASVNGEHRQCGICAACMLRRTSLHAAGYQEDARNYIWENLGARDFRDGASKEFKTHNQAQREYAIAGTLHMDHLAALKDAERLETIALRQAIPVAKAMGLTVDDATRNIIGMVETHAGEWSSFLQELPQESFVRNWAEAA